MNAIITHRDIMQEYDNTQEYQDTLARMQETTTFQQRFGQHHLYQNNHWQQYAFHNMPAPLKNFTFLRMATYSCGGQTHEVAEYIHDLTEMECTLIPGGTFQMGSENGYHDEKPVHKVTLDSFLISKHVVTQRVWKEIMGTEPWKGSVLHKEYNDNYPILDISWFNAVEFCNKVLVSLPTEAQWEYACKARTETKYYWGDKIDDSYLWYKESDGYLHEVGMKKPNAFGLYDMLGSVPEWCKDWYGDYLEEEAVNPEGPDSGSFRVLRGGIWNLAERVYSTSRDAFLPEVGIRGHYGFRFVFSLLSKETKR